MKHSIHLPACAQSPSMFTGSDVRVRDPDLPLLHFALAFKGAAWTDPDAIPLMVIQSIIGAWNRNAGAGAPPAPGSGRWPGLPLLCVVEGASLSFIQWDCWFLTGA